MLDPTLFDSFARALEVNPIMKKWKHSFETIIIIISLTTNFIVAFHGLYLLAAHSFQSFLLSFRVEHVENRLQTMLNKMCYPIGKKGYCVEHNMTVHLQTITGNTVILLKICL